MEENDVETMPERGTGWHQDVPDDRDFVAHALFGAVVNLPAEASLREYVSRVSDQRSSSSCVGQAIAKALHVRLRKLGFAGAPEFASLGIYTPARRRFVGKGGKLVDEGCYPRDAMSSIRDIGVPREELWPFSVESVDQDVPLDVFQDASKFVVFNWWRIVVDGAQRSDSIAQAIAKGYPVVFGMEVWNAFFSHSSGTIESAGKDEAGGHMMVVLGYRRRSDGSREFLVLNSWGEGWGEAGYCWIHERVICGDRCSDLYVIQVQ